MIMNQKVSLKIKKIEDDIKSIKVQGATNVALATIKGVKLFVEHYNGDTANFFKEVKKIGEMLSLARENEPLARNFLKFIHKVFKNIDKPFDVEKFKVEIIEGCNQYEAMIADSKVEIIKFGTEVLASQNVILTHCHSSTAVTVLKNVAKLRSIEGADFKVVSTETRPLYQGRKTSKKLFEAGVDVTLITDSACASFIVDDEYLPVGAIIVGCDELLIDGSFINKVGSYSIALAAQKGKDEFYVATSLLKLETKRDSKSTKIEQRDICEVWKDAPEGLKIINPAFELVSAKYVTGYITEAGVIKADSLLSKTKELYPWLF